MEDEITITISIKKNNKVNVVATTKNTNAEQITATATLPQTQINTAARETLKTLPAEIPAKNTNLLNISYEDMREEITGSEKLCELFEKLKERGLENKVFTLSDWHSTKNGCAYSFINKNKRIISKMSWGKYLFIRKPVLKQRSFKFKYGEIKEIETTKSKIDKIIKYAKQNNNVFVKESIRAVLNDKEPELFIRHLLDNNIINIKTTNENEELIVFELVAK